MAHRAAGWLAAVVTALIAAACMDSTEPQLQGWVEADLVFVAPDEAGRVVTLLVDEGDKVGAGQLLFTVDDELHQADLRQRQAAVANARQTFKRAEKLLETRTGSRMTYDNAQAALREAEAQLSASEVRLARRKVHSPVNGVVQRVYYRPGEMVPAGRAVLSILSPGNVKVRFYAPQALAPRFHYGQVITFRCDGCKDGQTATIRYISGSVEFTPPVIYSLEERSKLMFLIEAQPEHPEDLRVGQPVSVLLPPGAGAAR
jgi:HlyD family secretion protein